MVGSPGPSPKSYVLYYLADRGLLQWGVPPLGQGGSTHRAGGCGEGPLLKPGRASGPGAIQGAVAGASRACRAQWGRKENAASFESVNKVGFLTTFKRAALSTSASGSQGMSEKAGGEGMGFHPELDS